MKTATILFVAELAVMVGIAFFLHRISKAMTLKIMEALPYTRIFLRPKLFEERPLAWLIRIHKDFISDLVFFVQAALTAFGGVKRTLTVHATNLFLIYLYLISQTEFSRYLKWPVSIYVAIGLLIVCESKAITEERFPNLKLVGILWLRLYYSWFWPIFLTVWVNKHNNHKGHKK